MSCDKIDDCIKDVKTRLRMCGKCMITMKRKIPDHVPRRLSYFYLRLARMATADSGLVKDWRRRGVLDTQDAEIIGAGMLALRG